MQDLDQQLASELADPPQARFTIADTMAAGRRAVRRRRLAAGGAVLTAALVVGGTAWTVAPGRVAPDNPQSAAEQTSPTPPPPTTEPPLATASERPLVERPDGGVVINPDAEVLRQRPFTSASGTTVETYHLRLRDREFYAYIGADGGGSFPAPAQGLTLREWAAQSVDGGGGATEDGWVEFDRGSHLVAVLDGLTLVRQLPDPGLGPNFAGPTDPTALAEVRLDGTTYFLAVRATGGTPAEGISYRRDRNVATLQEFRNFAIAQYAGDGSGGSEGLR